MDIREKEALADIFATHDITSVVHFAGLKAVGESVAKPLLYYQALAEIWPAARTHRRAAMACAHANPRRISRRMPRRR